MRHAKAAPHNTAPTDYERELTQRGQADAHEMGTRLREKKPHIQAIIASPAERTRQTAELVARAMQLDLNIIRYNADIYEASTSSLARIVSEINDSYDKVMLVGHNPTFTDMMEYYTSKQIDNLPTAGIYLIEFETNTWKEAAKQTGSLIWADWPKA